MYEYGRLKSDSVNISHTVIPGHGAKIPVKVKQQKTIVKIIVLSK